MPENGIMRHKLLACRKRAFCVCVQDQSKELTIRAPRKCQVLCVCSRLFFITALCTRHYLFHFSEEESQGLGMLSDFPKVMWLSSTGAGFQKGPVWPSSPPISTHHLFTACFLLPPSRSHPVCCFGSDDLNRSLP